MWALPETQDFTLCFCTLLQSPSSSSYFRGFLEAGICGIVVHHSHSLHSVRQLQNSPLAQPLVLWPHRGDTRSPHQSYSSWHPHHASGSPGLLINGYSPRQPASPSICRRQNQPVSCIFFMLSLSLEQLVKIQAAFNSCTVKHKHRQAFANTQLQTEIIPTQIACYSSAAHTEFENSCKQKETWHLTGKNNFLSWF